MIGERIKRLFVLGLLAVLVGFGSPALAGPTVDPGWDLFETVPPTFFLGVPFTGVPLGSFDFGAPIGVRGTGSTDTIVQRLEQATVPDPTIPIEMVALQLMSAAPVNFGLGVGFYFVTLQSARGGPATVGTMTINGLAAEGSPHGTFDSFFDVFFDVRLGGLAGPIALSGDLDLTAADVPWGHLPPPGSLEIAGVNTFLNGSNREADFWSGGAFTEQEPTCTPPPCLHTVQPAVPKVPLPASLVLVAIGAAGLLGCRWRGRRAAA